MPPSIPPQPTHLGRGDAAREYLSSHGFVPTVPSIRSSDYTLLLEDPFKYYLTRILCLVPALSWSKALSRGSWFHKCLEIDDLTSETPSLTLGSGFDGALADRELELRESCESVGIQGETLRDILAREVQDANTARAWYEASSSVEIDKTHGSWRDFLRRPYWCVLSREHLYSAAMPHIGGHKAVIQPDLLLYHRDHKKLWVVDAKTTDEDPVVRMTSCPVEFQTNHYLRVLSHLQSIGHLPLLHPEVTSDATIGGMIHVVVRKPDLVFGLKDRNFTEKIFVPSRGPNKGVSRLEKTYHGEPLFCNFLSRVRDWYAAANDYTHLAREFAASPPCNISFTTVDFLDDESNLDYHDALNFIHSHATRNPTPNNFLRNPNSIRAWGSVSKYAPFYLLPVSQWPSHIAEAGLVRRPRP